MEEKFKSSIDVKVLNTLIFSAWYYYIEGDVNQIPISNDYIYFLETWKKYADYGITHNRENDEFCLICGYTLMLHGFIIGKDYHQKGMDLIETCIVRDRLFFDKSFISSYFKDVIRQLH